MPIAEFDGYDSPSWREIRPIILERDNHTCQMCGNLGDCIDHIIPWKHGGSSDPSNLQVLCRGCNSRKTGIYNKENNLLIPIINRNVNIRSEQKKWIKEHHFNLSSFVREKLEEMIQNEN